jgi:hypothetical protein
MVTRLACYAICSVLDKPKPQSWSIETQNEYILKGRGHGGVVKMLKHSELVTKKRPKSQQMLLDTGHLPARADSLRRGGGESRIQDRRKFLQASTCSLLPEVTSRFRKDSVLRVTDGAYQSGSAQCAEKPTPFGILGFSSTFSGISAAFSS